MTLALTRKREKEIKKLRKQAEKLWAVQRKVGERANVLAHDAATQAKAYGNESVVPEARRLAEQGVSKGRAVIGGASRKWNDAVLPAVASGLGSFAAMAQVAKDERVKDAISRVNALRLPVVDEPKHKGPNAWQWVLIGVGAVAVAGTAYAVWQTLRADDDLWIPDELDREPGAGEA